MYRDHKRYYKRRREEYIHKMNNNIYKSNIHQNTVRYTIPRLFASSSSSSFSRCVYLLYIYSYDDAMIAKKTCFCHGFRIYLLLEVFGGKPPSHTIRVLPNYDDSSCLLFVSGYTYTKWVSFENDDYLLLLFIVWGFLRLLRLYLHTTMIVYEIVQR